MSGPVPAPARDSVEPALVVWDFDGVLNANTRDGRFVWADRLKEDLGIDPDAFARDLFGSGIARQIMRGQRDLAEYVQAWLVRNGHDRDAGEVLRYWFEKDRHLDPQMLDWAVRHAGRRVIGTNNEAHRARFIEEEMGLAERFEAVFASGRMGVAKPDPGFFAQIERWSALPPQRILLIDDTAGNIAACTARGWQGFHLTAATRDRLPERLGLAA
ncbi:HAD family hydrolase [Cognatishimia sp. F0-27]|uniref:HAD family hydrolase n=1 Tax=Cognatishimia sp. F0-27 TaxID=2816855 RepID=UPI001D0C2581|nr:HAD-IA family hydrolase [Cognatishimia sp. F0-27]MCC1494424.1 HAD-IA family hydrolase [Cognatishimia sp. F0-27]